MTAHKAVFDCNIASFDVAGFPQTFVEGGDEICEFVRGYGREKPIVGIADCCARAASGHPTAAPPRSDMNSRRFHSITSSASNCISCAINSFVVYEATLNATKTPNKRP
jgi:hypothetical protein